MREQLIQYVNLLFAGASDYDDIKQEILQNTLDRYDDLIAEGKVPEAAYRLAISGIGDINEILGTAPAAGSIHSQTKEPEIREDDEKKKKLRATAIALYILCPIPLFIMSEMGAATVGLCGLLIMVAIATALIIMSSKKENEEDLDDPQPLTPQQKQRKTLKTILNLVALVVFFLLSITTGAWYITWLVFPIAAVIWQLLEAIRDLKEANRNEV